jgi:predicted RNA-binding Zn-ribbon protein involved in translation (DUF1610 family)
MSDILIQHQCPQCGAPITLAETERLVNCGFCRVRSYLLPQLFFRYMLPHRASDDKSLVYVPYWRYKGMLFFATDRGMQHRFLDASRLAVNLTCVPPSLGVRSQAMTLQFVTPKTPGRFIRPRTPFTAATGLFDSISVPARNGTVFHQTDIGEAISLIYAPFYRDGGLHDAVLNQRLCDEEKAGALAALPGGPPAWKIRFLPTLCPGCGWDMEGQRDSLAMICRNCDSVWRAGPQGLKRTRYACPLDAAGGDVLYLPFWRFAAGVSGLTLETFADLVRIANLPRVVQPQWETQPFRFWSLAFKVRPATLLQLSQQMNLGQPEVPDSRDRSGPAPKLPKGRIHPVNLPVSEAVESLKITLASIIRPARAMLPRLPDITITPKSALLVYLPFTEGAHEYTNGALGIAINKQHVALAGNL